MITGHNTHQGSREEDSFLMLLASAQESFEKAKTHLKIARAMKAMEYDLPDIFEATGLQPEIIQSL